MRVLRHRQSRFSSDSAVGRQDTLANLKQNTGITVTLEKGDLTVRAVAREAIHHLETSVGEFGDGFAEIVNAE